MNTWVILPCFYYGPHDVGNTKKHPVAVIFHYYCFRFMGYVWMMINHRPVPNELWRTTNSWFLKIFSNSKLFVKQKQELYNENFLFLQASDCWVTPRLWHATRRTRLALWSTTCRWSPRWRRWPRLAETCSSSSRDTRLRPLGDSSSACPGNRPQPTARYVVALFYYRFLFLRYV